MFARYLENGFDAPPLAAQQLADLMLHADREARQLEASAAAARAEADRLADEYARRFGR